MIIAIVITGLSVGGAETMLLKLLERMDRQRFEPHVISLTTLGSIGPRIATLGIPVEALGMRPGWPNPWFIIKLAAKLRALRPAVVHTWMYHADLLGGLAARLAGIQALAWCIRHSDISRQHNKRAMLAVARACALLSSRLPRRILVCSEAARRSHADFGYAASKMLVVPNGFDVARFKPDAGARTELRSELELSPETLLVGLVGRADPQKNQAGFVEAMALLHQRMPSVHFVLAGQGVDSSNAVLARAIRQAGIGGACHLLGYRQDMPRIMAALDVLVSSSLGESFANVLGEAMACGVPCAVTDVGDSACVVADTGRVAAPGDAAQLAAATQSLLALPVGERAELGRSARERIQSMFEIGHVVRRYENFYEGLLHDRPAGNEQPTKS